jgi:hypothetical protein
MTHHWYHAFMGLIQALEEMSLILVISFFALGGRKSLLSPGERITYDLPPNIYDLMPRKGTWRFLRHACGDGTPCRDGRAFGKEKGEVPDEKCNTVGFVGPFPTLFGNAAWLVLHSDGKVTIGPGSLKGKYEPIA